MRTIRVKAFLPYPTGRVPGQRFRIEQWAPLLGEYGVEISFCSFLSPATMDIFYEPGHLRKKLRGILQGYSRVLREARDLDGFDVVYVYREAALLGGSWIEGMIAKRLPVIFDFDDAIYLTDVSPANRAFGWLKSGEKARSLCRISAGVVVGNSYLAQFARQHNSNVAVVPSSIDLDRYRPRSTGRPMNHQPVIGWMGSRTSQRYLEDFLPVLRRVVDRDTVDLRVVSDLPPDLDGLRVSWRRWTAEGESGEIGEFDVGIMPLPDTPWTRGKCAMKALQYMGMGVPAVCSPVGMNRDLVRQGENGILADTADEWVAAIASLLSDPSLRVRLGVAGRETVEREYCAPVCAKRLAAIVRDLL